MGGDQEAGSGRAETGHTDFPAPLVRGMAGRRREDGETHQPRRDLSCWFPTTSVTHEGGT